MKNIELSETQEEFVGIIWENEPIMSGELVKICEQRFQWKKSTTYTVLHRLCEKGVLKNDNGYVSSALSREEYHQIRSWKVVNDCFEGSVPSFLASFTRVNKLTPKDISDIQKIIDDYKKENQL